MEKRRGTRGFTLLELALIVVIVSILSSFGMSQYFRAIEKARGAEARSLLGKIRSAQVGYFLENRQYASSMNALPVAGIPTACTVTHFYHYSLNNVIATASRCTVGEGGKIPVGPQSYTIALSYDPGTWSCDPGWC